MVAPFAPPAQCNDDQTRMSMPYNLATEALQS